MSCLGGTRSFPFLVEGRTSVGICSKICGFLSGPSEAGDFVSVTGATFGWVSWSAIMFSNESVVVVF